MTEKNFISTPAFIFDDQAIHRIISRLYQTVGTQTVKVLLSTKACSLSLVVSTLAQHLDGISCSSIYEGLIAKNSAPQSPRHLVTPGIRPDEIDEISNLFDCVVLNSIAQLRRFGSTLFGQAEVGLRVNPQLSFAEDTRFDPCRRNSKLGVPIDQLVTNLPETWNDLSQISGIHLHNNCESTDAKALGATVDKIAREIPELLHHVNWVNLGGGYLLNELEDPQLFLSTLKSLKHRFDVQVIVEPGAALVRQAGSLVTRVIDLFPGDDVEIAVLDTSVNHMPEVLEYQYVPDVLGHVEGATHKYLLAGATCLAGDQFGISHFDRPLEVGSLVTFPNAGAYTISRTNMFNGLPLPHIYKREANGSLILERAPSFEDFASQMGLKDYASV